MPHGLGLPKASFLAVVVLFTGYKLLFSDKPAPVGDVTTAAQKHFSSNRGSNRTLVILIGGLRGGEQTWESLYHNVLDVNHADLALAVGYTEEKEKFSSLYHRAKYTWEFPEYTDWTDALDLITNNDTSWHPLLEYHGETNGLFGGCGALPGSGAIIFWIRWFLANKIRSLSLTKRYDRFVVTRSDHYYLCAHDLAQLSVDDVWLPRGQNYGGYTDRHVIAPANKILGVLNILPPILQNYRTYMQWRRIDYRSTINPELLIKLRWTEEGIHPKRFDRVMFTCAVSTDTSRWASANTENAVEEGVHLKYEGEYTASYCTCLSRNCTKAKKDKQHVLDMLAQWLPNHPSIVNGES